MTAINLDAWWDELAYRETGHDGFTGRGSFILRKLKEHDPIRFKEVMDDLYRDEPPTQRTSPSSSGRRSSRTWAPPTKRSRTFRRGWGASGDEYVSGMMVLALVLTAVGLILTLIGAVLAGIWGSRYPGTLIVASGYEDFARKQRRMARALRGGLLLVAVGTVLQLAGTLLLLVMPAAT
jgi:hypothetical protein